MRFEPDLRLYAVLDPTRCAGRDPLKLAMAAEAGGATLLQLRDKSDRTHEIMRLTEQLVASLAIPVIVNDRVEVALAERAAGVHLGQDDMTQGEARRLLGAQALIGVTVHQPEEVAAIDPEIVDYAGIGPVFTTMSKEQKDPAIGPDGLRRLITATRSHAPGLPCCGIAGIDAGNAASVIAAGAEGVAVISALFMVEDVEAAARELRAVVDHAIVERNAA